MAGRFVIQKFASSMFRSRTLLQAYDASVRAGAPFTHSAPGGGIRTVSHLFHGYANQPGSVVPNKVGLHGCGGIRIPSNNNIQGAAHEHSSKVFPSNCGTHGFAARNSYILPCSADKTSCLIIRKPSTIITRNKPAFANRTFSSGASTGHEISTAADWQAEWDALDAKLAVKNADFNKFMRTQRWLCGFACFSCLFGLFLEEVTHHIRSTKGRNVPRSCSTCSRPTAASDRVQNSKAV